MTKSTTPDREQAQYFNPLIGISLKDTADNVASLMRSVYVSENLSERVLDIISQVVASALEYETSKDGEAS